MTFFAIAFSIALGGCGYLYARLSDAEARAKMERKNAQDLTEWITEAREACIWHDRNLDAMILKRRVEGE